MAEEEGSVFETYVGIELPLRVASKADPAELGEGLIAVTDGAGLSVKFVSKEEIAIDGKSAYEVAVEEGFVGTEVEWLASLKGKDGDIGPRGPMGQGIVVVATISQQEFDEIVAEDASEVGDAYLVDKFMYVYNGTDWVKSNDLQGPAGRGLNYLGVWPDASELPLGSGYVAGDTYVWRKSLWTLTEQPERKWVDIGVPGPAGKSAYETWVEAGNTGSQVDFLNSLKGTNGTNGKSAYEIWLANGHSGTEVQFLASLEGKNAYQVWLANGHTGSEADYIASLKGEQGDIGPDGRSAYQVWVAIPENAGKTEAQYLQSLKGTPGEPAVAFTIAGKLETTAQLPTPGEANKAYYVGKDLYVWIEADNAYENFGSLNGDSAYQIAVSEGFVGTQVEWLASLNGTNGTNGKSAYEIWVAIPANAGKTEAQFLKSLEGQSAYQLWLDSGHTGTEAEFIASLRGTNGTNGTNGKNLQVKGTRANAAAIQALVDPVDQDAWVAQDTGNLWVYTAEIWVDLGPFRGTNGTNGTNGKSAYEIALANNPAIGTETEWLASLKGTNGTNGKSAYEVAQDDGFVGTQTQWLATLHGKNLQISGSKANLAAIQAIVTPANQEAWVTLDTGRLYIYNGTEWVDAGRFRGTDGKDGDSAYQIWLDEGNTGDKAAFLLAIRGTNGTNGRNVVIKGAVADLAALPTGAAQQDAYTLLDTGHLYMYINTSWTDLGQFKGDKGEIGTPGERGQGINILGEVDELTDLPDASTLAIGDAYYVVATKMLYQVNDAGVYGNGITIVGPEGPEGQRGIQGEPGTSISIMGSYATEAELKAAQPTGESGKGYLVGPDLYLWGIDPTNPAGVLWYNAGPVRGPVGPEGPIGKTGLRGLTGKEGERGSLWLKLPDGVEQPGDGDSYGRVGDWAINSVFDAFYRDPVQGWILIGRLVAGDVNSPLAALGKMVREGTEWVPLPVDAVPNAVQDKTYLMKGIAGGKTQWTQIDIPATIAPDVPTGTTEPQGLTTAGWVAVAPSAKALTGSVRYEMLNGAWTESIIQGKPSTASKPQCYQVDAAGKGSWVNVSFDTYSLLISATPSSGAFTPALATQQAYQVSTTSQPVITLPAFTTGRSMLAVFTMIGATNKASFLPGSGVTLGFSGGILAADIEYGATQTVITAFWTGFGTWIISKGPSF